MNEYLLHENLIMAKSRGIIFIYFVLNDKNKLEGPFCPTCFQ